MVENSREESWETETNFSQEDFWLDSLPDWVCALDTSTACWPTIKTHLDKIPVQMKQEKSLPKMILETRLTVFKMFLQIL